MSNDRSAHAIALLGQLAVDALLITNETNRRYLSGFTARDHAIDEPSGQLVVTQSGMTLLAPSTNLPWARAEAYEGTSFLQWASGDWTKDVAGLVSEQGVTTLGIEEHAITHARYLGLREHLPAEVEIVLIGSAADRLRAVKGDDELALIRRALEMTDTAMMAAQARMDVGMTERELADIVREELRNAGSDGESFETIVASGPNAAKPHHAPSDRAIQAGEPVIIDMGALYQGYAGDLTRTVWLGEPDEQLVTIYRTVQEAFDAAEATAAPGVTGVEFDRAARDVFERHDLGVYFTHSLGHGLGLRVHEAPSASQRSQDTLAPGHVVTIEPGLYIEGWGGVRIEDVVLITENGAENLTRSPKRVL